MLGQSHGLVNGETLFTFFAYNLQNLNYNQRSPDYNPHNCRRQKEVISEDTIGALGPDRWTTASLLRRIERCACADRDLHDAGRNYAGSSTNDYYHICADSTCAGAHREAHRAGRYL